MSEENLAAMRRANDALRDGDLERSFELFHPDVVYHEQPGTPLDTAEILQGLDEIRASMRSYVAEFPDFHSEIDELLDAGDKVVCVQRWKGTGRGSGVPIELEEIIVWTFRDGKAVEGRVYPDRNSALEAAGLSE